MRFKDFLTEQTGATNPKFLLMFTPKNPVGVTRDRQTTKEIKDDIIQLCKEVGIQIQEFSIFRPWASNITCYAVLEGQCTLASLDDISQEFNAIINKYFTTEFERVNFGGYSIGIVVIKALPFPSGTKVQGQRISMNFQDDENVSLKDIHKQISTVNGTLTIHGAYNISSNVLGLLLIKGLTDIDFDEKAMIFTTPKWIPIIKKHFREGKDVMDCQEELIQAGYKDYARL